MRLLMIFPMILCACQHIFPSSPVCYRDRGYATITRYRVVPNVTSKSGIKVDDNNSGFPVEEIERDVGELEECLATKIKRNCIEVKIADDWVVSPCTGRQYFPCGISPEVCKKKIKSGALKMISTSPCQADRVMGTLFKVVSGHREPCTECICGCAATIQRNRVIVTTPDLYLFKAELARLVTNINDVWGSKASKLGITKCVRSLPLPMPLQRQKQDPSKEGTQSTTAR